MTVYVDGAKNPMGRMRACHMMADTRDELHRFAGMLGLKLDWFQDHPAHPHYDVSQVKRAMAIEHGAQPVTSRDMVAWYRGDFRASLQCWPEIAEDGTPVHLDCCAMFSEPRCSCGLALALGMQHILDASNAARAGIVELSCVGSEVSSLRQGGL